MRRLALILALGLVMAGLLLAAVGEASRPSNDAPSASYGELATDAPAGFSGETAALSVEPPSVRRLDQMLSDYVYDTPAVARVGAHVVPGDGGVSSPAVAGGGVAAVPAVAAGGASTTLLSFTSTPRATSAVDDLLPGLPSSAPRPLGLGSTGRTAPADLTEQLAMTQVRSAPGGRVIPVAMTDARWPASAGWVKVSQRVNGEAPRLP